MLSSYLLPSTLFVAAVLANPFATEPSRVYRRQAPEQSAYPIGDPCEHEWRYLNFDPDDDDDKTHLRQLHDVICSGEMRAISSYGSGSARRFLAPYRRYFPQSDEEDDFQTHVGDVLDLIAGESSTDGRVGSIVGTFVVDNLGEIHND